MAEVNFVNVNVCAYIRFMFFQTWRQSCAKLPESEKKEQLAKALSEIKRQDLVDML